MRRKIIYGIISGAVAGVIDVVPMIIQKLPIAANISAFSMWVILGFLINSSTLNINPILKGLLLSIIVVTPTTVIIGANNISDLIPIYSATLLLGSLLGFISGKLK